MENMRLAVLFALMFGVAACGATAQPAPSPSPPPNGGNHSVVLLGDSIIARWQEFRPQFFSQNGYINKGESGDPSSIIAARFQHDVVDLKPVAVLVLAGSNDVAGWGGMVTDDEFISHLQTMADKARSSGIKIVISSVPPRESYGTRVLALNEKVRAWAAAKGIIYADFASVLAMPDGAMNPKLSNDNIHPNAAGYALMEPIAIEAIQKALSQAL